MKAYVGVTDSDWFRFLRQRPDLDEVNFWQPGGSRLFQTLAIGQPFLFKLHAPQNFIVGGGFFTHSTLLPCSRAWDAFGDKNGAASLAQMRGRIEKYRRAAPSVEDYTIGCIVLRDPFFLVEEQWIPIPRDFHLNIVQGKSYDLASETGAALWESVLGALRIERAPRIAEITGEMYGDPVLTRRRLGQGAFKVLVTDTYERRCAITGGKVLPVLIAAHIKPVASEGRHRVDNGMLLRSDIHTLFDRGYVTVTPDHKVKVSNHLKTDFNNGEEYLRLRDQQIWLPHDERDRPGREFLEWHADTVFKA